ncbi:MAG: Rpn family recombination-promoting nuclease/putative transposase [Turicibacter sp.]|nr:Rpn family recombination-promoting nuclease/putative transposase [Turicibacter sp.]
MAPRSAGTYIEIQRGKYKNLAKRSRYYQGSIDLDCIQKGSDYLDLCKSFIIFICTFDLFEKGRHLYTFENRCIEDPTIKLNDETKKIFLNTKGFLDDVDDEMKEFLTYIENSTDNFVAHSKSELVHDLHYRVTQIKKDKRLEVEYMTLYERYKEEFENGKAEGIEQGAKQEKLEIAKNLIQNGLDDELISKSTGLPLSEVLELRK